MSAGTWLPDGHGLSDVALDIISDNDQRVHLRLTNTETRACRSACDSGLGEWWSGVGADVTCPACLEVVHA